MEWVEIMRQRDRIMNSLAPYLGQHAAWERANDIMQAVLVSEAGEAPERVVLRMLLRDLDRADATRLASGLAGPWAPPSGRRPPTVPPVGIRRPSGLPSVAPHAVPAAPAGATPRRRRETKIIGLWN